MSHIRVVVMTESPKAQPVKKDEEVRVVEAETPNEVKVAKEKVVKAKTVKAPKKGAKKASA
jgi:hypothetical protein